MIYSFSRFLILGLVLSYLSLSSSVSNLISVKKLYAEEKLELLGRFADSKSLFPLSAEPSTWVAAWPGVGYRFRFGPSDSLFLNSTLSSSAFANDCNLRGVPCKTSSKSYLPVNERVEIILHFKPCRMYNRHKLDLEPSIRCSYDIGLFINCEEIFAEKYIINRDIHMITFHLPYSYVFEAVNELKIVKLFSHNFYNFMELEAIEIKTPNVEILSFEKSRNRLNQISKSSLSCDFPSQKHGLFIGDSITAGGFMGKNTGHSQSYAWLVAAQLDSTADYIALNAAGITRGFSMPQLWDLTIPSLAKKDFPGNYYQSPLDRLQSSSSGVQFPVNVPQYVVFALGTNDFAMPLSNAEEDRFVLKYTEFSTQVLRHYTPSRGITSKIPVVFTCSPMKIHGRDCPAIQRVVESLRQNPAHAHLEIAYLEYMRGMFDLAGPQRHPSVNDNAIMAAQLGAFIKGLKKASK